MREENIRKRCLTVWKGFTGIPTKKAVFTDRIREIAARIAQDCYGELASDMEYLKEEVSGGTGRTERYVRHNFPCPFPRGAERRCKAALGNNPGGGEEIDALPDGMVGLSEMHEYGYSWDEMLPLTKERASELFGEDVAVYRLHADGSETLVEDSAALQGHDGLFGVEKGRLERLSGIPDHEAGISGKRTEPGSTAFIWQREQVWHLPA